MDKVELRSGTKISLLVCSDHPAKREYLIERTVPNPPIVRDETGEVLALAPSDIMPKTEVYGQHEISDLTKSPEKLTRLLERFVEHDPTLIQRKSELKRQLERSRSRFIDVQKELEQVEERLASLPALEETLKRFQDAGIEERLKEQSLLIREERIVKTVAERFAPFHDILEQLRRELPIDRTFVSKRVLEPLPGKDILSGLDNVVENLSQELTNIADRMEQALKEADEGLTVIQDRWKERKRTVQTTYEKILRELQKSRIDGQEFIQLRQEIEDLRPLRERRSLLERNLKDLEKQRRTLLVEWEDAISEEFRQIDRAARKVNKLLAERVRVTLTRAGNRQPLVHHLKENIIGRLSEVIDRLEKSKDLSLKELADACRSGKEALVQKFGLPAAQADRLAQASAEVIMGIEELDLPATTLIELNVAGEKQSPNWQTLEDLSTGQKATAVLLLLLLESDAPLIVDQPEDDLDNRFITEKGLCLKCARKSGADSLFLPRTTPTSQSW